MSLEIKNLDRFSNYERLEIQGKWVWVPQPTRIPAAVFVERPEVVEKAMTAWLTLPGQPPLNFRLYGPPGVGKNAIVYYLAATMGRELYIINGHEELGPEDIACSATMTAGNAVEYVASPVFAAMLRGGICFFDEIGKAPTSALDPLASVLDDRRTLSSVLAGIHLRAHDDFLFCAALNENEETGLGLPGFIDERTRPAIHVGYPPAETLEEILRSRLPEASDVWFRVFLREFEGVTLSTRNAITVMSYAFRMAQREQQGRAGEKEVLQYLRRARQDVEKEKRGTPAGGGDGKPSKEKRDDLGIRIVQVGESPGPVQ